MGQQYEGDMSVQSWYGLRYCQDVKLYKQILVKQLAPPTPDNLSQNEQLNQFKKRMYFRARKPAYAY